LFNNFQRDSVESVKENATRTIFQHTMKTLNDIRTSHPLVFEHFSKMTDGAMWLRRIQDIDLYWQQIGKANIPSVIKSGSELPANTHLSGEYDLIYAGATLGLLHAAAMSFLHGKTVLVLDKHTPAKTHRDWNISLKELARLEAMGLMQESETRRAITKTYKTGFVEFAASRTKKRLFIDKVLDCAIDSDVILKLAAERISQNTANKILGRTAFKHVYKFPDHVIVEAELENGTSTFFKARVFVDTMGVLSPVAMQLNGGVPQTHCCPTVGTLASGLEDIDYDIGEILVSTEPADFSGGASGRQLIWEGFPASERDFTTYLFFYDKIDSGNDKSLLNLFEVYFQKLPAYKKPGKDFTIHKPVFGIIPAYHHDGFGKARITSDDRIVLFGDAASLSSPLTFCGFGSMVRNLERTTTKLANALNENTLSRFALDRINAYEPNVAIMSNLMKFMCYNRETDEPNFVNDLMNEIMFVLDELPPRYRETMFRDEMSLADFTSLILTVGGKYPKIFPITYQKLGISGSVSWLQNWAGWAFSGRT
jgi:lycopene cyclase CruA